MPQVPTPPASPAPEKSLEALSISDPASESSIESLDALLERYLHLLDRHQTLQAALAKQLSSGFFSLAQANYASPGRRYGQDYYDERTKATRTMAVELPNTYQKFDPECEKGTDESNEAQVATKEQTFTVIKRPNEQPNPSSKSSSNGAEEPDSTAISTSTEELTPDTSSDETRNKAKPAEPEQPKSARDRSSDPISWFGILVPAALRSAQGSFTSAVEDTIPMLASVIVEMRDVERQVEAKRG